MSASVKYRSIDGDMLEAVLLVVDGDRATIDVKVPGCSVPLRRTRIPYLTVDNGLGGVCFGAVAAPVMSHRARRAARCAS